MIKLLYNKNIKIGKMEFRRLIGAVTLFLLTYIETSCDFNFISCVDISRSVRKDIIYEREFEMKYYKELRRQAKKQFYTATFTFNTNSNLVGGFSKDETEIFQSFDRIKWDKNHSFEILLYFLKMPRTCLCV